MSVVDVLIVLVGDIMGISLGSKSRSFNSDEVLVKQERISRRAQSRLNENGIERARWEKQGNSN